MSLIDEIRSHSNGAQFVRGDLHIHSYPKETGSYDVTDTGMTPEGIVDAAVAEKLKVIAITDHNAIGNVRRAVKYAEGKGILVVPGVELSTQQGHLLVYCPTPEALESFYGKLSITSDKKACSQTIPQCLELADQVGGFGILAHIDGPAGLEEAHAKFDTFKEQVLTSKNLLAIELLKPENNGWYSLKDDSDDRKRFAKIRCEHLGYEADICVARVMGSDAHTLAAFGKNAQGNKRLTRFKLESLTFDSLRIALLDGAARVRLEDLIPSSIPKFVGMKLEGGFLKDQVVHFSPNLTCIIGGRGAGKSTLLEALRTCAGHASESSIVDCEIWPDCVTLIYEDEVGQQHTLTRAKASNVIAADPDSPDWIAVDSYGQGQTAETIQHCDKDPSILLKFLDSFIDLAQMQTVDDELRESLLSNQTDIERLHLDVSRIAEVEKQKKIADTQVETLKKQNASEVVELEQKLATEQTFHRQLQTKLDDLLTGINDCLTSEDLKTLIDGVDGSTLAVGITEFAAVKQLIAGVAADVDTIAQQIKTKVKEVRLKLNAQLATWTQKERETKERIETIRRDFATKNIKLDIGFIRKVTKDANDFKTLLETLKKSEPKLKEAWIVRKRLVTERRALKNKMFMTRQAFASAMNGNLASCVVEYSVHLKFAEGLLSKELEDFVKEAMQWRTSQVPKAAILASHFSPLTLVDHIEKKNTSVLEAIRDSDGNKLFSKQDAEQIITTLGQWKNKCALERCEYNDRPQLKVTKEVTRPDGSKGFPSREFSQLSLGQQQSILLTILLFSKSKLPLIIDQPEDNLDSEFIYTTLVRSLRNIKEHRQVIIVTHNANIAVLGDAELIVPLRGASEQSVIRDRGSIDTPTTKKMVCTILEGSEKAFKRRHELYGFGQ